MRPNANTHYCTLSREAGVPGADVYQNHIPKHSFNFFGFGTGKPGIMLINDTTDESYFLDIVYHTVAIYSIYHDVSDYIKLGHVVLCYMVLQ